MLFCGTHMLVHVDRMAIGEPPAHCMVARLIYRSGEPLRLICLYDESMLRPFFALRPSSMLVTWLRL